MTPDTLFREDVSYTEAEQLVIDFVTAHPAEFLVMPIQQLSERLGISGATVSRFARHAGFKDFKELKSVVATSTLGPAEKIRASIERGGGAREFLESQRANLDRTMEVLDEAQFARAADLLASARRVLLLGKGAAGSLAELLRFRLVRFGKDVSVLALGSDVMEGLANADEGTVLLAFGFGRIPAEATVALDHARSVGATTVFITGRQCRVQAADADVVLVAYRGEPLDFHSMTSAVALLDALVVAVAGRMNGEALGRLERLKSLKRSNDARLPR